MRLSVILSVVLAPLFLAGAAHATEWTVDPAASWLGFTGTMAGAAFEGRFSHWDARITFDPAQAEVGHAVVSIDTASAVTGDRQRDQALPQGDWFDAKAFPKAIFEAQSFRWKGANSYEAIGTLTIRNVKKDVVMPLTIEVSDDNLHAKGRLDLVRTDYGVGQGAWSSSQWVALEVAAAFDVTAVRQK
jgi:polyisoprenoid-binding protein YceI